MARENIPPDGSPDCLEFIVGRTVFHPIDTPRSSCPNCGTAASPDEMSDAINVWFDTGFGEHPCPACGTATELNDRRWEEPRYAFGYFGLRFWNWPELGRPFIGELSVFLGHRVVWIASKL